MSDKIPAHVTMQPVESSQIHSIGHDADANHMFITFKNKGGVPGSTYRYENVTAAHHTALLGQGVEAHSIGSHFGKTIKKDPAQFPFTKLNPDEAK